MNLMDFFFTNFVSPTNTELRHLRRLEHFEKLKQLQKSVAPPVGSTTNVSIESLNKRLNQLEDVIGFQSLIIQGILTKLDEKGTVSKNEIREILSELDELDGVKDGKLNINTLLFLLSQNT
ncbi:MAG: hypothetical protein JNL70_04500 [Saprospiraceae bacterium]|nr:hypothetical protein [Saprospiraceae bacterium]